MANILQDLRYGFRVLLKSPGFTALAIIALALGIGANTAVFSVAIAFLRKPVALPNLDRLVVMMSLPPGETPAICAHRAFARRVNDLTSSAAVNHELPGNTALRSTEHTPRKGQGRTQFSD